MKKVIYILLLAPLMLISQTTDEYLIIENATITANPTKIAEFEKGLASHNKKYHSEGAFGARTYWITNGDNAGKYVLVTGPLPWSALDNRPNQEGHSEDWNKNVAAYAMPNWNQTYWKFQTDISNFPKDFMVNKLHLSIYDIKRFKGAKAVGLMKKIHKVMTEKFPDDPYGIYTNEMPSTKEGRDMVFVSFFNKSSWMGEDIEFPKKYDEVHGDGSFAHFLKDWEEVTVGGEQEVWLFRKDLSGISGEITAAQRQ